MCGSCVGGSGSNVMVLCMTIFCVFHASTTLSNEELFFPRGIMLQILRWVFYRILILVTLSKRKGKEREREKTQHNEKEMNQVVILVVQ